MVKEVVWSVSATEDLEKVIAFISEDSPEYANIFYQDVKEKSLTLKHLPVNIILINKKIH